MLPSRIRERLDSLPADALVLDVGGWARVDPRADWVIDIGSYETRNWYRTLGEPASDRPERAAAERWVQMDICSSAPWPFEDDMFDYVICAQTLEDVRDPVRVCEEMGRVGKAGYIETPDAAVELTRGIDSPHWCGWMHHRWLVELESGGVTVTAKPHHIHSPLWPAIRSPRLLLRGGGATLELEWAGTLTARETILVEREAVDAHLLGIVRRSARPDSLGAVRRRVRAASAGVYRIGRRTAGRVVRR